MKLIGFLKIGKGTQTYYRYLPLSSAAQRVAPSEAEFDVRGCFLTFAFRGN